MTDREAIRAEALDQQAAFLTALAEAGIPPDVLEMLVRDHPAARVPPGALGKALANAGAAPEGWRPIESAPKDGSYILLYDEGSVVVAFWNGRAWDDGNFHDHMSGFTHWMPLPAAPVPNGKEG